MDSEDPGAHQQVEPPAPLLIAAVVAQLASGMVAVIGGTFLDPLPRHITGWLLASLLGFTLIAGYRRESERRRYEEPAFADRPVQQRVALASLWVGVALVAVHAWGFATHVAS